MSRFLEFTLQKIQPTNQIDAAKGNAKREIVLFRLAIHISWKDYGLF